MKKLSLLINTMRPLLSIKVSVKHTVSAVTLMAACFFNAEASAQYVHTNGTKIVDENGAPIYFNGMNLGNWLLWEGYLMMGDYNYRTHTQFLNSLSNTFGDMAKAKEFENQWRLNYVNEQTIIDLKNLGYNSVRVPFHYNMFWQNGALSDAGFVYFDRLVSFCKTRKMYILLDMHAAPGYQNPGDHSDNVDSNSSQPRTSVKFWDGNNITTAAQVWKHIANRYKNEPIIWGYDLFNEPVPQAGREYEMLSSLIKIRNAIREVDNNHIIVAEGSWWASDMSKIDWSDATTQANSGVNSRWDNNLVYQTHHYVGGNAAAIADLNGRVAITNKLNVPLILGEYGEDSPSILRTMTDWAAANIAGAFPWSFKKMSHDKTLWTVNPNAAYSAVVNAINSGSSNPGSYNGAIDFAKNNIGNGAAGLVWHQDFYDATKPACTTKAPASLAGTPTSFSTVNLIWQDNASGEDGYRVTRNGTQVASLAANSTSFNDFGLIGETCYNYVVTTLAACSASAEVKVCTPCNGQRSAYTGQAFTVPGTVEAESFDLGCQGLTYSDTTSGNSGGAYRTSDVDISTTVDNGQSGYNVGWVAKDEWLEYSVNVQQAGTYSLSYRIATPQTTGQIQFMVGVQVLSTTSIASTGDWNTWESVSSTNVTLAAGNQIIRIKFSGPEVNLNNFTLTLAGAASSSKASSASSISSISSVSSSKSSVASSSSKPSSVSSVTSSSKSSVVSSSSKSSSSSTVTGTIISGRTYAIISKNSGKALDVSNNSTSNGATIQQWTYGGSANQLWTVTQLSGTTYKIISNSSGKSLDVSGVSTSNGAAIQQWDYSNGANQHWIVTDLGNGYFKVIAENSNKSLDVKDVSVNDGAGIQQWDYSGGNNQQWQLQLK